MGATFFHLPEILMITFWYLLWFLVLPLFSQRSFCSISLCESLCLILEALLICWMILGYPCILKNKVLPGSSVYLDEFYTLVLRWRGESSCPLVFWEQGWTLLIVIPLISTLVKAYLVLLNSYHTTPACCLPNFVEITPLPFSLFLWLYSFLSFFLFFILILVGL